MANFDTPVNPVNAPDYINSQRGTDRAQLQGLASVPKLSEKYVSPDWAVDKSAGVGLKDLGSLLETATKVTDQAVTNKVNDTVSEGVNQIRSGFITAQAAALGQDPATGKSIAPDENGDQNVPGPVAGMDAKMKAMQTAYKQGVFDDTAYMGKMDAYVSQMKAMFPGYADTVDEKVKSILGVTPANALRAAQRSQLDELNKKLDSAANKQEQREHEDAAYISKIWPSYFKDKAEGRAIPSWGDVQTEVSKLKARDYDFDSKSKALAADKSALEARATTAETLATQKLTDMSNQMYVATTNSMNLHSMADFQKLADSVTSGKRGPFTPDEKTQISQGLAQLEQAYNVSAQKIMTSRLSGPDGDTPHTFNSLINNPTKQAQIIEQGKQSIKNMKETLTNDQFGLFQHDATWNKATQEAAAGSILRSDKSAGLIAGSRQVFGDNGMAMLLVQNPALNSAVQEGYRKIGLGLAVQKGTDNSLTDTFSMFRDQSQMDPKLWKVHVDDAANTIINKDKIADQTAVKDAVKYLYGPKNNALIDSFKASPGSQAVLFAQMFSPNMVNAVKKLDAEDQKTFYNAANAGFAAVYGTQANTVNQATQGWARGDNLSLKWNPDTGGFEYEKKGGITGFARGEARDGTLQRANSELLVLNKAISTMKPVWAAEGRKVNDEVFRLLPTVGIYPHTPLYEAVHKQIEADASERVKNAQGSQ